MASRNGVSRAATRDLILQRDVLEKLFERRHLTLIKTSEEVWLNITEITFINKPEI
jgi:hypothetical protein